MFSANAICWTFQEGGIIVCWPNFKKVSYPATFYSPLICQRNPFDRKYLCSFIYLFFECSFQRNSLYMLKTTFICATNMMWSNVKRSKGCRVRVNTPQSHTLPAKSLTPCSKRNQFILVVDSVFACQIHVLIRNLHGSFLRIVPMD